MKISVLKLVKSRLKKININNLKKKLDKKVVLIAFTIIFISIIFTFFLRPVYFNFQDNKKTFESHIYNNFNLKTKIRGKIDYNFFPTPRIEINNVDIVFKRNEKNKINIKRMYITISPFYLKNIEDLKFSKILVSKQKINIYPSNLKEIFNHFSSKKKKNLKIINSEIYFIDDQNNKLKFDKFNLSESFLEDKHNIFSSSIFSGNEIKIKFTNNFNSEKYLKISVPNLKQSLNIKFDQSSNLTNLSGEMKLDIFQSILLLNFKGKDEFKISNSYLRNKFLNSKINGTVSFKNPFYFNLKMNINRIHLKKALKYFPILEQGNLSKKINGKINFYLKSSDSIIGKIKDVSGDLKLQNGDLSIDNFKAILPEKTKINADLSINTTNRGPKVEFKINLSSTDAKKFLRKFGLYDYDKNQFQLFLDGNVDTESKKIKLKNIIKNNVRTNKQETSSIEKNLRIYVLDDGVLGFLDFFKIKRFLKEPY